MISNRRVMSAGIFKSVTLFPHSQSALRAAKIREPGRMVGTKYVQNRIVRGKVIEELRDAPSGLSLGDIGKRVCIDWNEEEHGRWLSQIIEALRRDRLLTVRERRVSLAE